MGHAGPSSGALRDCQGILFDFAYTLFYPRGAIDQVQRAGISPRDARRHWAEIWSNSDAWGPAGVARDLDPDTHRTEWLRLLAPLDRLRPGVALAAYQQLADPSTWAPYSDVSSTLAYLKNAGYKLGLVSNTSHDIRAALSAHGLVRLFSACVLSCEAGVAKPDARIFQLACEGLDLAPDKCLMIGDTATTDSGGAPLGIATVILGNRPDWPARRLLGLRKLLSTARPKQSATHNASTAYQVCGQ